jgi:hypothetical protein
MKKNLTTKDTKNTKVHEGLFKSFEPFVSCVGSSLKEGMQ